MHRVLLLCFLAICLVIWMPALRVVHGVDIGDLLYALGMTGWLLNVTLVPMAATLAIGLFGRWSRLCCGRDAQCNLESCRGRANAASPGRSRHHRTGPCTAQPKTA